jgi:hypothetical protein
MPQAFAVHSVVEAIAAVVGVGVLFVAACVLARRRLQRGREATPPPIPITESGRVRNRSQRPVGRRAFKMPVPSGATPSASQSRLVAIAPLTRLAEELDLATPSGPLAPAHLYDLVSREYIMATAAMPTVGTGRAPLAPVAPLARREPRYRPDGTPIGPERTIQYQSEQRQNDQRRVGWFGEDEVCG